MASGVMPVGADGWAGSHNCDTVVARLGQRRLGVVLQELRRVGRGHAGVRRFGEIRDCGKEKASVLVL
jgi:hypothetical protein